MFSLVDRIRGLIDFKDEERFQEIVQGFKRGALREPSRPVSDSELRIAVHEYLGSPPSTASLDQLQRQLDKVGNPLQNTLSPPR